MSKLKKLDPNKVRQFYYQKVLGQFSFRPDGIDLMRYEKGFIIMKIITPVTKKPLLEIWLGEAVCMIKYIHRILALSFDGHKLFDDWKKFLKENLKNYNEDDNIFTI